MLSFFKTKTEQDTPTSETATPQTKRRAPNKNLPLSFDMDPEFEQVYHKCNPYTMTSQERQYNLYKACQYIVKNNIPGVFVECGVWAGGSTMTAAETLKLMGDTSRHLYLYDTFGGMSEPTEEDIDNRTKRHVREKWEKNQEDGFNNWCYIPLEEVQDNLSKTGYPSENIHYVKGDILQTIPQTMPEQIAILRLDTDWYASTKHELEYLYPLLTPGGILIIDDYGTYDGARKAVDEYFAQMPNAPFMSRIDNTGRILVKH
jgi:O-methyltransferase